MVQLKQRFCLEHAEFERPVCVLISDFKVRALYELAEGGFKVAFTAHLKDGRLPGAGHFHVIAA